MPIDAPIDTDPTWIARQYDFNAGTTGAEST